MATAAYHPSDAISYSTLELYHALHGRCPRLSIQSFVHAMCDLNNVSTSMRTSRCCTHFSCQLAYTNDRRRRFSVAYDVFCEVKHRIATRLDNIVLKNETGMYYAACPCCTYRTADEPNLQYSILVAIDGNESLKRVMRAKPLDDTDARMCIERSDT